MKESDLKAAMSKLAGLEIEHIMRQELPPKTTHKLDGVADELDTSVAGEIGEIKTREAGPDAFGRRRLDAHAQMMPIDALVLHETLLDRFAERVVNAEQVLAVRTGACASRARLNAEQVVEQRPDEVRMQIQACGRVLDHEREDGQPRHAQAAQDVQVRHRRHAFNCFSFS